MSVASEGVNEPQFMTMNGATATVNARPLAPLKSDRKTDVKSMLVPKTGAATARWAADSGLKCERKETEAEPGVFASTSDHALRSWSLPELRSSPVSTCARQWLSICVNAASAGSPLQQTSPVSHSERSGMTDLLRLKGAQARVL